MKRSKKTVLLFLLIVGLMGATLRAQGPSQINPNMEREMERLLNQLRSGAGALTYSAQEAGLRGGRGAGAGGAWWTNAALLERLGLTEDQKSQIERTFENHRQNIVSTTGLLEKEELQLGRLLEAETIDRNAILTQIDRVIQARGEMERTNAAMTLEMRGHLTRAQWLQLPRTSLGLSISAPAGAGGRGVGGQRTGGPPPSTTPEGGARRGGRGPQ